MKALNVRLSDEVVELLERREGELRDMSVNTIVNVAVRRMLTSGESKVVPADDETVAAAVKRIIARDSSILEALKNL